jgi:hypothetical protein
MIVTIFVSAAALGVGFIGGVLLCIVTKEDMS